MIALWRIHISFKMSACVTFLWSFTCFSIFRIEAIYPLLVMPGIHKPELEKKVLLDELIKEVLVRAKCNLKVEILTLEAHNIRSMSFGGKIILISKGALQRLTKSELSALLALEVGHLLSKDSQIFSAFAVSNKVPHFLGYLNRLFWRRKVAAIILRNGCIPSSVTVGLIVVIFIELYLNHLMFSVVLFIFCFCTAGLLEPFFIWLWMKVYIWTEFEQDDFVQRLGYGQELGQVLQKTIESSEQKYGLMNLIQATNIDVIRKRLWRLENFRCGHTI